MAGKFDEAKGRTKEAAGDVTGDDEMKAEGKADRATGTVKDKAEEAKEKVGGFADKVKDKFTK